MIADAGERDDGYELGRPLGHCHGIGTLSPLANKVQRWLALRGGIAAGSPIFGSRRSLRFLLLFAPCDRNLEKWETGVMGPIDKKMEKEVKEGKIPKPIEDLPSEWREENREIDGAKPDLGEIEEDPSEQ